DAATFCSPCCATAPFTNPSQPLTLDETHRGTLAHKVGGGRKDIIAVVAIRTSLASLLYAQVLHAFPSDNLFNWLLTTSAVFVVILLMEIHWHRKVLQ
ncbi:hypothetical protein, partial [Burkholderia cepacia]|uniref:hypothetical protein n=2 Tax=Burkholderia cepacia TaxID=292 RepID=UPI001C89E2F0